MPSLSAKSIDSSSLSYLNQIPFDLKDDILSLIDDPRHLISMALTSKDWSTMIIPNHLDYRRLHIRWPGHEYIWAHLALRADLAKNIRSLRFTTNEDPATEKMPRCLQQVDDAARDHTVFGPDTVVIMTEALRNFKSLKEFAWVGFRGQSPYTEPIFNVLRECSDLEELHLVNMLRPQLEPFKPDTSVLKNSNLKKLTLHGKVWANFFEIHHQLVDFLNRSPDLQELTISYNPISNFFTSCALPRITKLHLYAESSSAAIALSSDRVILEFIESHPSIEDLMWYPRDERLNMPQGLLPNLKRLHTKDRIAKTLLYDNTVARSRKMEELSQISLGPNTVNLLRTMDGTNLQELHLWRFEDLEQIDKIAGLFPNIRTLDIPNIIQAGKNTVDECIDTLSRFLRLERYLDSSLWLSMHTLSHDSKQATINKLGTACPNLWSVKHWKTSQNIPWEVVLTREDDGEVRWMERLDPDEEYLYKS